MTPAPILVEQRGPVLIVTLNRPDKRNAVNLAMASAIAEAMDELDCRDDLTVGVLAANGPSFCAGMDLKAFLEGERPSVPGRGFAGLVERPPHKPLIAAVDGHAVAGGFEIVLACDLIVAASHATFGLPEVKRGLVAGGGGLLRIQDRVPYHHAMEWALTGRAVTAQEALDLKLVNRLAEPGGALDAALALADEIGQNAPLAVRATKQVMVRSRDWPFESAFSEQAKITEPVRSSQDAREGATAFREKRAAVWAGV
ncbi:crotonase/enoyl-CoA hydratase family protein [Microbacterium sp. MAHUQ-60]|uniref:crotonase/enoyl-CoA hydratase family protein n=1 Tax=unclassified Microbacterium TaxID=2609290 RepID=UPI0036076204